MESNYKIEIDVVEAVRDFYPGLSPNEINLLAEKVTDNWDYSDLYQTLSDTISAYADFNHIDLKGKEGVLSP
tara:strand:- start:163 stop:378 length:216 start_codon:yes stop_codon:yes gene_type:complete